MRGGNDMFGLSKGEKDAEKFYDARAKGCVSVPKDEKEEGGMVHLLTVTMSTGDRYCLRAKYDKVADIIRKIMEGEFILIHVDHDPTHLNTAQIVSAEDMIVEDGVEHDWWVERGVRQ